MIEASKGKIRLAGDINNPKILLQKSPDEVRIEFQRVIDTGVDIIFPECAFSLRTPLNNQKAIVEVYQNN